MYYSCHIETNSSLYDPDILSDLSLSLISIFKDLELDRLKHNKNNESID